MENGITTHHNLRTVEAEHARFYDDRAQMEQYNADLSKMASLLVHEVTELNGHAEDGMTLEKYREQELADIALFALGLLHMMQIHPSEATIQASARSHRSTRKKWSERHYHHLRAIIRRESKLVQKGFEFDISGQKSRAEQALAVEIGILGPVWAIFSMLRVNPVMAVLEKISRNHLKHAAWLYADPSEKKEKRIQEAVERIQQRVDILSEDSEEKGRLDRICEKLSVVIIQPDTYERSRAIASLLWSAEKGNEEFYMPFPIAASQIPPSPATMETR